VQSAQTTILPWSDVPHGRLRESFEVPVEFCVCWGNLSRDWVSTECNGASTCVFHSHNSALWVSRCEQRTNLEFRVSYGRRISRLEMFSLYCFKERGSACDRLRDVLGVNRDCWRGLIASFITHCLFVVCCGICWSFFPLAPPFFRPSKDHVSQFLSRLPRSPSSSS
jgi:hypothetical protein